MFGRSGIEVIESAVGQFSRVVDKLEKGIEKCGVEKAENCDTIDDLNARIGKVVVRNDVLEEAQKKGAHVVEQLKSMLGVA